ncbi:Uncharacterised protein [Streptococcus dysgalactiae subsp. equisimilis]|nr:Uncharacterised protein [Streptococcus dysgalactiae subsp. equisimilis]
MPRITIRCASPERRPIGVARTARTGADGATRRPRSMQASARADRSRQVSASAARRVRSRQMMRTCWRVRKRRRRRPSSSSSAQSSSRACNWLRSSPGRQRVLQLAALGQLQQHRRVAHRLLGDEITGRSHSPIVLQALRGPGVETGRSGFIEGGDGVTKGIPGAFGGGQQGGRQIHRRRQAHGLSCLGFRPKTTGSTHNVGKALQRAL